MAATTIPGSADRRSRSTKIVPRRFPGSAAEAVGHIGAHHRDDISMIEDVTMTLTRLSDPSEDHDLAGVCSRWAWD